MYYKRTIIDHDVFTKNDNSVGRGAATSVVL